MRNRQDASDGAEGFRATWAIRDALSTRAHAEMLFEMVRDLLGETAWVETANGGTSRTLFRRETAGSRWIRPWPLLRVRRGGREGPAPLPTAIPGVYEEPKVRPGPAPKLRGLGPGEIDVHDGPHRVTISYGGDGRWFECARSASPEALEGIVAALAAKNSSPVELVASFVAGLDLARHGSGLVLLPVALPGGVEGVWNCGIRALRDALFQGRVPRDARFAAVDGWIGRALGSAPTRDAAIAAWRAEVARLRPFPARPAATDEPLPDITIEHSLEEAGFSMRAMLRGPSSDVPWVTPTIENSPAVLLHLADLPMAPPPFGEWTRLVGSYGTVFPAALLRDREGFTLVGDQLLGDVDPERLDELLAAADRDASPRPERPIDLPFDGPDIDSCVRVYRLTDEATGLPCEPTIVSSGWSTGFHAGGLDGDEIRARVVRLRVER